MIDIPELMRWYLGLLWLMVIVLSMAAGILFDACRRMEETYRQLKA